MKDQIYELLLDEGDLNAYQIKEALGLNQSIHQAVMELEKEGKIKRKRCFTDKRIYELTIVSLDKDTN